MNQCLLRASSGLDWTRGEIEHSQWSCSKVTIAQTKTLNLKELDNVLVLVNLFILISVHMSFLSSKDTMTSILYMCSVSKIQMILKNYHV